MWDYMGLIRVYTKRRGAPPEFKEPLVMSSERRGVTVEVACENISRGEYRVEPAHTLDWTWRFQRRLPRPCVWRRPVALGCLTPCHLPSVPVHVLSLLRKPWNA